MATKLTNTAADSMLVAIGNALNTGYLRIYSGTEPSTAATALSGNTLLSEMRFGSTAFGVPATAGSNRRISANSITADSSADNDGVATFFRALQSDGTTVIVQGSAGAGLELVLTGPGANPYQIYQGGPVTVSSLTITLPLT